MRVLIVDDIPLNHQLLSAAIRDLCTGGILIAERATEAIEIALTQRPDLIFMDLGLPDFNGLDAMGVIRGHPTTSKIPIVVVSAHALPDVVAQAEKVGCESYITKPISISAVRNTVLRFRTARQSLPSHRPAMIGL